MVSARSVVGPYAEPLDRMMDCYHARSNFIGHAFCPLSQVLSIKNCCCETNACTARIPTGNRRPVRWTFDERPVAQPVVR
jgi:hypothetical protein